MQDVAGEKEHGYRAKHQPVRQTVPNTSSAGARTRLIADGADARQSRGRYFTLQQTVEEYPVFTLRLLRRLVQERRIAFSRVGRYIVLSEADIHAYVEAHRVEPPTPPRDWHMAS